MSSPIAVFNGHRRVPPPVNEPIKTYAPGSPERASLKARLKAMASEKVDMPLIIGGKEVKTGTCGQAVMPHDHSHVLGEYQKATEKHVLQAVDAARAAQKEWSAWSFDDRAAVILKAGHVIPYHYGLTGPFPFVTYASSPAEKFRRKLEARSPGAGASVVVLESGESWHHYH